MFRQLDITSRTERARMDLAGAGPRGSMTMSGDDLELRHADAVAVRRGRGAEQLRVDCPDGVRTVPEQYERLGFARVASSRVRDWPGAILGLAL